MKPKLLSLLFGIPEDIIASLDGAEIPVCSPSDRVAIEEAFLRYGQPILSGEVKYDSCACQLISRLLNGQSTVEEQRRAAMMLLAHRVEQIQREVQQTIKGTLDGILATPAAESTSSPFDPIPTPKKKETIH